MLPEFSTEPRELPWQPKLCKNKPKFHRFQFSWKLWRQCLCVLYSKVFGVGEFKYANKNFRAAKGVAIATKFTQKGKKCTDFSSVRNIVPISTYLIGFRSCTIQTKWWHSIAGRWRKKVTRVVGCCGNWKWKKGTWNKQKEIFRDSYVQENYSSTLSCDCETR